MPKKRYFLTNLKGKFENINEHCLFGNNIFIFLFSRNKYNLIFLDIFIFRYYFIIICSDAFNEYGTYICINVSMLKVISH